MTSHRLVARVPRGLRRDPSPFPGVSLSLSLSLSLSHALSLARSLARSFKVQSNHLYWGVCSIASISMHAGDSLHHDKSPGKASPQFHHKSPGKASLSSFLLLTQLAGNPAHHFALVPLPLPPPPPPWNPSTSSTFAGFIVSPAGAPQRRRGVTRCVLHA